MSATQSQTKSLIETLAEKAGISPDTYYDALVRVPFAQCKNITREEMTGVLLMAKKLDLDPFAKEIYAVPGRYENAPVTPVIAFDGWMKILLRQATYDGMEISRSEKMITPQGFSRPVPEYCEVTLYVKDRAHPVCIREYFEEVNRAQMKYSTDGKAIADRYSPWVKMPWRMLRAKTIIQAVRNAYPVGGFEDSSELETDPGFVDASEPVQQDKPSASKASPKVIKPGFPTVANKDALISLLDRLIVRTSKEDKSLDKAIWWVEKNIAADSQQFAIQYLQEKLNPVKESPSVDEFDLEDVKTVQPSKESNAKSQTEASPKTVSQPVQTAQTVTDPDPLGGPDADCFGLESFVDDIDIDQI